MPVTVIVTQVLSNDDFDVFEIMLRRIFHDKVHALVGGTMASGDSASAPEFFLHHGFIDKIWDDWQKKNFDHKDAFFPTVDTHMPGSDVLPVELIDLSSQPGDVHVEDLSTNAEVQAQSSFRSKLKSVSLSFSE